MDETVKQFSQKAKDQAAETKENARATVDQAAQAVKAAWQEAKNKMPNLQPLEAYIREKPTQAVLVAFGAGFIFSLFARR
jgi:ElaB/YqjD/DUF883 family membrane-anchored ribosome-binding protein